MAVFPPGDVTYLDRFARSDGDVWAGAGATLWDDIDRDGNPSQLRVGVEQLKSAAFGGGLTNENVADFIRILTIGVNGGGFGMGFGYRITSPGASVNGYRWTIQGTTATLYKLVAGVETSIYSVSIDGSLSTGERVAFRAVGSTHEIYRGTLKAFGTTPIATFTDGTHTGAGQIEVSLFTTSWIVDDYAAGGLTFPTSGVTIYVDPEHPAAGDEYNRTQASDPSTPLLTAQAAGWLARADTDWHDEILIRRNTTRVLDGTSVDPYMQPALDYRSTDRGPSAVGWPYGSNEGNETITIRGEVDPNADPFEALPTVRAFGQRGLNNWSVEDLQFGFDVGSGYDHNTLSNIERVTDITWRRCLFTGGLGYVSMWSNAFIVEDCRIHAPLDPANPTGGFRPGAGLNVTQTPGEGTGYSVGQLTVTGTEFSNIRGEDAIVVFSTEDTGDPLYAAFEMNIVGNVFANVVEGEGTPFHTDSIQGVSIPRCNVDRNAFIACSDALILSDGRHGDIRFTRNLTVAIDTPLQLEGVANLVVAHNTFNHADSPHKDASILFYNRAAGPKTVATIVNNIIGGFYMRDAPIDTYFGSGTVIENNIVMTSPGLVTAWGTNLPGIAEFGTSSRLDVFPVDTVSFGTIERDWEPANSPTEGPGVGEGGVYALGLSVDLLGRAYASPPDVGCLQSSPSVPVTPVPRPPYVVSRSPDVGAVGVNVDASVITGLYPVPGVEIDPATVTTSTAYVTDPTGTALAAVVTLDEPVDGVQAVTVDVKRQASPSVIDGALYPLVVYTAHLAGVKDMQGSQIDATSWSFRVAGPGGAAIGPSGAWTSGAIV